MALSLDNAKELGQILEANPIPTFVVDANSQITHWNRACELLTDIPAADMIGTDRHREAFYSERRELMADLIVRGADTAEGVGRFTARNSKGLNEPERVMKARIFFPELGRETANGWFLPQRHSKMPMGILSVPSKPCRTLPSAGWPSRQFAPAKLATASFSNPPMMPSF